MIRLISRRRFAGSRPFAARAMDGVSRRSERTSDAPTAERAEAGGGGQSTGGRSRSLKFIGGLLVGKS